MIDVDAEYIEANRPAINHIATQIDRLVDRTGSAGYHAMLRTGPDSFDAEFVYGQIEVDEVYGDEAKLAVIRHNEDTMRYASRTIEQTVRLESLSGLGFDRIFGENLVPYFDMATYKTAVYPSYGDGPQIRAEQITVKNIGSTMHDRELRNKDNLINRGLRLISSADSEQFHILSRNGQMYMVASYKEPNTELMTRLHGILADSDGEAIINLLQGGFKTNDELDDTLDKIRSKYEADEAVGPMLDDVRDKAIVARMAAQMASEDYTYLPKPEKLAEFAGYLAAI